MDDLRRLADAVLYEGYLLWPYRRSALKNQRRWTFGGVFPPGHSERHPDDRCAVRTEVLARSGTGLRVDVTLRFLHVVHRQVLHHHAPVDALEVDGVRHLTWDEATEREFTARSVRSPRRIPIHVRAGRAVEDLPGAGDAIVRSWRGIVARLDVDARALGGGLVRVGVRVANATPWREGSREAALERTLCSAHVVLQARGGRFLSATESESEGCRNEGLWPVLASESDDTMLAAPIILEDHPRIAPESPGDLFDGGEIDQMLVLNILTLTDEEKAEMRDSDPRTREILERTEALTPEELMRLHGAIREFQAVRG
jgi:hypothetical protein